MQDETVADALFHALLDRYWLVRANPSLQPYYLYPKGCLISYSALCTQAGVPFMTQGAGGPFHSVAVYCAEKGWPPINALAVNQQLRYPGPGYIEGPGCSHTLDGWVNDVSTVLAFDGYPLTGA